jgi:ribose transport system substrate-binding protein
MTPRAERSTLTNRLTTAMAICLCLSTAGCNRQPSTGVGGPPRVAFVMKTLNHPFFLDMQHGAEEAAARLGLALVVQGPDREIDVERQVQIVENLIHAGIRVLVVDPSGSREIASVLKKANDAGVPVIVVDTRVDAQAAAANRLEIVSFIGSDNHEGGMVAGRHLVAATGGRGRVAILEGIPGHETAESRLQGFLKALEAAPGLSVVASQPANWERDQGFTVFQNMLQAHPGIDAVFACNDLMALGAVEAVAAAGREGAVRVVGFDAIDDARRAIEAGRMDASVAQSPREMGRIAVETAAKVLRGEPVPAEQPVPIRLVTREAP